MRWLWLAMAVLGVQIVLALQGMDAHAQPPQWTFMAMQVLTLAAIVSRARQDPSPFMAIWWWLAIAIGLQLAWALTNALAASLDPGTPFLGSLAVVFSGLYMIPCMFIIARSFDRHEPRIVAWVDFTLSALVAFLLCTLIFNLMPGGPHATPVSVLVIINHADAIDFSLAAMTTLRLIGTRSVHKRFFYYAASTFLWINAIAACIYNRLELQGLPPWTGVLIELAYLALIAVLALPTPDVLRRHRPSRRLVQTVHAFAPVVLALGILLLAVSVSRFAFGLGLAGAAASVVLYALRVAFIQSRSQDMQRAAQVSNHRLQQQLGLDPLTGIANRTMLVPRLRDTLHEGTLRGTPSSLLMIDIDHFKLFNDTRGHLAGDECLCRVASVLAAHPLPADSLVIRYGGEEFAVVLPHTEAVAAREVAEGLIDAVDRLRIHHPASPAGHLTVSIGAATVAGAGGDPLGLIEAADRALYRAKSRGRQRCESAETETAADRASDPAASIPANHG